MNSVIVYLVPETPLSEISERLHSVERTPTERIYWHVRDDVDDLGDSLLPTELFARLTDERWLRVTIDYTGGLELVKRAVGLLVSGCQAIVDNDHGDLMTGEEFLVRLATDPEWDWRT